MFLRKAARRIVLEIKRNISGFYRITTKIDDKKVFFESYQGRMYACNPKALYEEMQVNEKYNDYKFVWAVRNIEKYSFLQKNKNTVVVKFESPEYYRELASAKYWIFNSKTRDFVKKKDGQIYLQTWHGTPWKKIGCDVKLDNAVTTTQKMFESYINEAKKLSYLLSPSDFCTEKLISAFNLKELSKEDCILQTGYPRNDALFKYSENQVEELKDKYNILNNKKVILYAPTFRDDLLSDKKGFALNIAMDFDRLYKEFGNDYIILFRAHYFIASRFDFEKYKDFVYDVSDVDDINDLYIISDMLITDYSSVFFDYANLKRPILFYMYDFDRYKKQTRDLYFDVSLLPGEVAFNMDELAEKIKETEKNGYHALYKKFNDKFNYLDGPETSRTVLDELIK